MRILISVIVMLMLTASQAQHMVELDKIVAEVEDNIILESDIHNMMADMERQKIALPEDAKCGLLEQQIISKLLSAQAKRDSLKVSDEEIERDIELRIRNFIQMYGSLENLEKVSGRTVFQIKQDFTEAIRDIRLAENMQRKILGNTVTTPVEVKNYFASISKSDLPFYESEIQLGTISMYVKPSEDLNEFLKSELNQYRSQVQEGKVSFDFLVTTYSQDPAKVQNRGIYQVDVNDRFWDPSFLAACFKLEPEQISTPVKTKFGYHLIKMLERRGTAVTVQHLLRMSIPTEIEIEETKKKLEEVKVKIQNKELTFEKAVELYSEDELAKFGGGYFTKQDGGTLLTYDEVDPDIYKVVKEMKPGDISKPEEFRSPQGMLAYRLIYLKTQESPHRESLEQDYKKISDRLLTQKRKEALNNWIHKNIRSTNWRVSEDYKKCAGISTWGTK